MDQTASSLTRRDVLKLGGAALAATTVGIGPLAPQPAAAQTPKRGGTFRLRSHVAPVHFDPQQTIAFSTMIPLSLAYSRLVKVKAGSAVVPGTQPVEGDLAESWERHGDNVYVFKLKKGVRWHNRAPLNGRELTAEDVRYSYDRFLTIKGNPNKSILGMVDKVEALDKYTVKFTLSEPNAWFIDRLASTSTWVVAKECVDQHGDLKKPESVVGTGPWMFKSYEPNVRMSFVRNPNYFVPGLPYADGVEIILSQDPAAGFAAFLAGEFDFGPEYGMVIRRSDLDIAQSRVKGLGTRDYIVVFGPITAMKIDQEPFKDVRVRRAFAMSDNWQEGLDTNAWSQGKGTTNPLIPAALKEWSIPIGQLPEEGRRLYEFDPAGAKKLLAEAGYPNGLKVPVETTPGYGPDWMDAVQVALRNWKRAGIEGDLKLKEYGAFVTTALFGKFDKMILTLRGGTTDPDTYFIPFLPGEPLNASGVNDPKLTEMIKLQRRTFDDKKRREIVYDIQRYASQQVYYGYGASVSAVGAWMPYVKNFGPNIGHDYGGRLMVAWLDK
jgi:peptide/nickel transport system substrate-binding protein